MGLQIYWSHDQSSSYPAELYKFLFVLLIYTFEQANRSEFLKQPCFNIYNNATVKNNYCKFIKILYRTERYRYPLSSYKEADI